MAVDHTDVGERSQESAPRDAGRWERGRGGGFQRYSKFGTLVAMVVLIVVFSAVRPDAFATFTTAKNILDQSAVLIVISVGLTVAMVENEFDLSIAAMATMSGMLVAGLQAFEGLSWPVAIIVVLCLGGLIGACSGSIVTVVGINSFIATLAVATILLGVTYWYNGGQTIAAGVSGTFANLGSGSALGIPDLVWLAAFVSVVVWLALTFTPMGREMYAIGGNREAARLAGVPVRRTRIIAFVIAGTLAALAGIMLSARAGEGSPGAGTGLLLQAFAACFLGSVTLRDGQFHVLGTVLGVLLLSIIFTGLTILGVQIYVQSWATGGVLIAAVSVSALSRRMSSG